MDLAAGPVDGAAPTPSSGVLTVLDRWIGPVPRVLLRDAADAAAAGAIRPVPREPSDSPGEAGRYQIAGEVARGGMGAIFAGRDVDLGRDLAIKVILDEHRDDPEMIGRFVVEAQIGGQLQHPGIVPVHELGRFPDGRLYIAMKLVRGRTLAALLEARADPAEDRPRFLSIFEQVCRTMAYAHARGVIHRDLKPSNVMVGRFGEVQVMDWGLAKVLEPGSVADDFSRARVRDQSGTIRTIRMGPETGESRAGSVLGTPAYMAPEQARGAIDALDERADVFGLGSILCEVLTGLPAYTGRSGPELYRMAERADLDDASRRLDATGADAELIDAGAVVPGPGAEGPAARRGRRPVAADRLPRGQRAAAPRIRPGPRQRRGPRRRGAQATDADGGPGRVAARHRRARGRRLDLDDPRPAACAPRPATPRSIRRSRPPSRSATRPAPPAPPARRCGSRRSRRPVAPSRCSRRARAARSSATAWPRS